MKSEFSPKKKTFRPKTGCLRQNLGEFRNLPPPLFSPKNGLGGPSLTKCQCFKFGPDREAFISEPFVSVSFNSPLQVFSYNMCGNFHMFFSQALSTVQQSMWGGTISQAHAVYSRPWNLIQQKMGPARISKKDMDKQHFHWISVLDGDSNCEVVDSPKASNSRARRAFGNVSLKRSIFWQPFWPIWRKSFLDIL